MFRFCDSPTLITTTLLRKFDANPPHTWTWQTKYDGVRRQIWRDGKGFHYRAKNRNDTMPMESELQDAFESLPWPIGVGLDCELMGRRDKQGIPSLRFFDLWLYKHDWIGQTPFRERHALMMNLWAEMLCTHPRIHPVPYGTNPGMCDAFLHQYTIDGSEGIVVRRFDSKIIGNWDRSVEHPHCFKIKFDRIKE